MHDDHENVHHLSIKVHCWFWIPLNQIFKPYYFYTWNLNKTCTLWCIETPCANKGCLNCPTPNVAVLGPLHTQDWEPVIVTLQALSLVEKAVPVQVRFTLRLRDQQSMWMQDGCKVYMNSYMVSNASCFMVTWIIFKNHLLKVGLTQNWEIMALWMLTTVDLF